MDYDFKNKNTNKREVVKKNYDNRKYKTPFVWIPSKPKKYESFEDMLQDFLKSSKERCKEIKQEFVSNTELDKLALKKAKKKASIQKKRG